MSDASLAVTCPPSIDLYHAMLKQKDFARLTSHSVRGWTGKNKVFCSPGTQNARRRCDKGLFT